MHKLIWLLLFSVICLSGHSQVMVGNVVDESMNPIQSIGILLNDKLSAISDENGQFILPISKGDVIKTKSMFWLAKTYKVSKSLTNIDTIEVYFKLSINTNELKTIDITQSAYVKVVGAAGESIVDYYPINEKEILSVKRTNRNHYLCLNHIDSLEELFRIDINFKPETLFLDALNNFHLVEKDSVHQIAIIDDSLLIQDSYTRKIFDENIKTLVLLHDSVSVYYHITNQNKAFHLSNLKRGKKRNYFFTIYDKTGDQVADSYRREVVNIYMRTTPYYCNIISLGLWDGDLKKLIDQKKAFEAYSFRKNALMHPIDVTTFSIGKGIFTIDLFQDSLYYHNILGDMVHAKNISGISNKKHPEVIKDLARDQIFIINDKRHFHEILSLNENSGDVTFLYDLPEYKYPENFKLFNGQLFFLYQNEYGLKKIMRFKRNLYD